MSVRVFACVCMCASARRESEKGGRGGGRDGERERVSRIGVLCSDVQLFLLPLYLGPARERERGVTYWRSALRHTTCFPPSVPRRPCFVLRVDIEERTAVKRTRTPLPGLNSLPLVRRIRARVCVCVWRGGGMEGVYVRVCVARVGGVRVSVCVVSVSLPM